MRTISWMGWATCSLALAGCGGDDEHARGEEDPAQHACEHVNESGMPIVAGTDRATGPTIAVSEEPYTLTVVAGAEAWLSIQGGIDALLFTKETGVVTGLFHEQATDSALGAPEPNERCPAELPEHFDLELEEAGTWHLKIGPVATDSVWLALTQSSGHAHP